MKNCDNFPDFQASYGSRQIVTDCCESHETRLPCAKGIPLRERLISQAYGKRCNIGDHGLSPYESLES